MNRREHTLSRQLAAAMLALGVSGAAFADGSSMGRFGGESYAYFNTFAAPGSPAASPGWRRSHPDGLTPQELAALSSSDLSAVVARVDPPVLSNAPADPTWRETHPNGLTERELLKLSASSLATWPSAAGSGAEAAPGSMTANAGTAAFPARLMNFLRPSGGSQ